jgi:ribosomal protein S18 acetylase RimI-like enzyme
MNPAIRMAGPEDVAAIVALVNRAYRPVGDSKGWTHESAIVDGLRITSEQVMALFMPDSFVFVAEQDSQLLACVHVQMEQGCAHMGMLATNPDRQAQGIGKTMLAYAEHFAVEHCSARQFEMVVIPEREELVAFYLRRGYQKTGRVDGYPVSAGVGIPKVQGLTIEVLQKSG